MEWLILLTAILLAVLNGTFIHMFNNRDIRGMGDTLLFNGVISMGWVVIMLIWGIVEAGGFVLPSAGAVFYGVLYGANLSIFLLFKMQSFSNGPVSLTSLISSCSFIIPTIFAAIYNHEAIGPIKWIGMAVMLVAFFLCINPKGGTTAIRRNWFVYISLFFCAGGMIGIINKLFQSSDARTEINSMMLVASLVSAVILIVAAFVAGGVTKMGAPKLHKSGVIYVLACAFVSCVYNRLNVYLAGVMPGALLFPISNGSLILCNTLIGVILFKEKLNMRQIAGIVIGFASIMMIGCFR